jgi:hypothetical protein
MSDHDHITYPLFGESLDSETEPVEFRTIPECRGYRFGSDGSAWTVWRKKTGDPGPWRSVEMNSRDGRKRIRLKHGLDGMGHHNVSLAYLVCRAWHGPCPEGLSVQYRDGEILNTRPDNLFWGTGLEHLAEGRKKCTGCGGVEPLAEFFKHSYTRDGFHYRCRLCAKKDREAIYSRPEARTKLRKIEKRSKLKYRYGISEEEYKRLLAAQGGVCGICGKPPMGGRNTKHLNVDHSHDNNVVRGLLCHRCNTALGQFGDNLEGVMKVVAYLQRSLEQDSS